MTAHPPKSVLAGVAAAAGLALAIFAVRHTFLILEVEGWSMAPALGSGDRLLVLRRGIQPRFGSVVLLSRPRGTDFAGSADEGRWLVKRVAAVAGDSYPLVIAMLRPELAEGRVPAGSVVVLGDNPLSLDSKQWGAIKLSNVAGVVIARLRKGAPTPPHSLRPEE
jgi:signal peptidase I